MTGLNLSLIHICQYWAVINSFGNGVTVKLTINNHRFDKEDFEKSILMPYYYDNLDVSRKEYNEMLLNKAATAECIVQDKYLTVTVNKKCCLLYTSRCV